jgi:hypothetical protein
VSLERGRSEREALGEVVAVSAEQADAAPAPVRQDAEAVVLDVVNPAGTRRRLASRPRQAWLETGGRLRVVGAAAYS